MFPAATLRRAVALAAATALAFSTAAAARAAGPTPPAGRSRGAVTTALPVPVLAYYYMWFNEQSWASRKTDLPLLGAYDSTNPTIIQQQVTWAKAAGIDALIASWKNTPALDEALAELVAECHRQGMRLVLIYEGLDVNRNAIPASTVSADIQWFADHYGADPVFDVYGKPAVIWSGTWKFSSADIAAVRAAVGAPDRLLLLGSEKDGPSYAARASLFDGDAYYWSSADPLSTPGYQSRLSQLASAVHAGHGLWLAPVSVGFDARLNGGTSVVDRRNGATLRAAWSDAVATRPDGIAVISWNEYTENSYIEPSRNYGAEYANVLASLTGAQGIAGLSPSPPGPSASGAPPAATTASPSASASPTPEPLPALGSIGAGGGGSNPLNGIASALVAGLILLGIVLLAFVQRRQPNVRPDDGNVDDRKPDDRKPDDLRAGRAKRRFPRLPTALLAVGLGITLAGGLVAWAIPNVVGSSFVEVRAEIAAVPDSTGPSVVLGTGVANATRASALRLSVVVTNRYPLPVVLDAGTSAAPFQAAVYQLGEDGKLARVWQASGADPNFEEGSDSPVGDVAARAAVVSPGATLHDASSGTDLSFPLAPPHAARQPGTYYVRVWAYGIGSPMVPFAIEPAAAG